MHFTCISGDIKPEDLKTNMIVAFQRKTVIFSDEKLPHRAEKPQCHVSWLKHEIQKLQ